MPKETNKLLFKATPPSLPRTGDRTGPPRHGAGRSALVKTIFCITLAFPASACVSHSDGGPSYGIYPAVRANVRVAAQISRNPQSMILILELPPSAVVDTVFLPVDLLGAAKPGGVGLWATSERDE